MKTTLRIGAALLFTLILIGVAGASVPVVGWGDNNLGALNTPDSASNVVAITAGGGHNLAIKPDGSVIGWGFNFYGQTDTPAGLPPAIDIAAGFDHSVAVGVDGSVAAWGRNNLGQTAVPAGLNNVIAVSANNNLTLALKGDGTLVGWGSSDYGQLNIPAGLNNVKAISVGVTHALALKNDGTVLGWGLSFSGQTTPPPGLANVVAIAAGGQHSLALKSDGTVVAFGANDFGQSTVPAGLANVIAISAGNAHSMALKSDGTVVAWGWNAFGQATVPPGLTGVGAISAGFQHSLALIINDTPPTITCPPNSILQCFSCNTDPANTGIPTANDNGPVRLSYSDLVDGDCPKVVTRTWVATDVSGKTASCVQTITCMPSSLLSLVTDSEGCTFDLEPSTPVQDFRLAFMPDPQNIPCYRLNASNPGQFYYNVFHQGTPGELAVFNISLPYPFVTKGANPIHAYDWVTVLNNGDQQCLLPGNAFAVGSQQITLASYGNPAQPSTTVSVSLTVPASGSVFLNLHLDYGLKKTSGFTKNAAGDAVDCATGTRVLIPYRAAYNFGVSGAQNDTAPVQSVNVFKKNPGVAGQVTRLVSDEPVQGAKLSLLNSSRTVLLSTVTDEDGFYQLVYKASGKDTTYYVSLQTPSGYKTTKTITLVKSKQLVQVDFTTP